MRMESMGELSDQPGLNDSAANSGSVSVVSPSQQDEFSQHQELSPNRSTAGGVSVANMIDPNEYRNQMALEPTYQTLNGRMSPNYNTTSGPNNYATLTPLQPLPPISTVSEKFGQQTPNVSGSFTFMQNNSLGMADMGMNMNSYRYDKLGGVNVNMGGSPMSMSMMTPVSHNNGYPSQSLCGSYGYSTSPQHNGLHSPKQELKPIISPNNTISYDPYSRSLAPPMTGRLHSPNPMMSQTINGLHQATPSPQHSLSRERTPTLMDNGSGKELEEINTKELAQKISSELKRYSIPQAVFAQRVLCRSQGTLSDLLRNPKPWSKLKSGRETFRRMWKWLQEPEFQRMSALRLAGI
ncbi:unnamed protein product, partial [Owenia fusiformis]